MNEIGDIRIYNRKAWDLAVERGNRWTVPVDAEVLQRAREGDWKIVLTPTKPIPRTWFPELTGASVLCLASGGGQQGPVLAAAGADVTVFDNSSKQLDQDRGVAEREHLALRTVEGDMRHLSPLESDSFDLIVHPVSNCFVDHLGNLWRECHRVLRPGGALLAGFANPVIYTLDQELKEKGVLQMKYALPYSDVTSLTDEERRKYTDTGEPLVFGHTLTDQIGGQLKAGLLLTGFYEDICGSNDDEVVNSILPCYLATRAVKP